MMELRKGVLSSFAIPLNIGLTSMACKTAAPPVLELAVTVGLFAGGMVFFGFAERNLPLEAAE